MIKYKEADCELCRSSRVKSGHWNLLLCKLLCHMAKVTLVTKEDSGVCRDLDQGKHIHTKWVQNLLTFGTGYIFKELKESDMTHSGMKNGHQNDNCPL